MIKYAFEEINRIEKVGIICYLWKCWPETGSAFIALKDIQLLKQSFKTPPTYLNPKMPYTKSANFYFKTVKKEVIIHHKGKTTIINNKDVKAMSLKSTINHSFF